MGSCRRRLRPPDCSDRNEALRVVSTPKISADQDRLFTIERRRFLGHSMPGIDTSRLIADLYRHTGSQKFTHDGLLHQLMIFTWCQQIGAVLMSDVARRNKYTPFEAYFSGSHAAAYAILSNHHVYGAAILHTHQTALTAETAPSS